MESRLLTRRPGFTIHRVLPPQGDVPSGLDILLSRFPGRCSGLSHSAPLGRREPRGSRNKFRAPVIPVARGSPAHLPFVPPLRAFRGFFFPRRPSPLPPAPPRFAFSLTPAGAGSSSPHDPRSPIPDLFLNRAIRAKKEPGSLLQEPGIYLATTYSHKTYRLTTIGAAAFHFRVRNGTGWFHRALVTRGQHRSSGAGTLMS
jgi:hypothetical protein